MDVSSVLKGFRNSGYDGDDGDDDQEDSDLGPRTFKLSGDEMKSVQSKPGESVTLQVTGRMEEGHFHVMSVAPAEGMPNDEEKQMAAQVAGQDIAGRAMPSLS